MLSRLMTRKEQLVLFGLGLAIAAGAVSLAYHAQMRRAPDIVSTPAESSAPLQAPEITTPAPPQPTGQDEGQGAAIPAAPAHIKVGCMGAVRREGLYSMGKDARVNTLILRAGGLAEGADASGLNLAALLLDGSTLRVPWAGEDSLCYNPPAYLKYGAAQALAPATTQPPTTGSVSPAPPPAPSIIHLNTASPTELESLPGIGPALAQRIVAYREQHPFMSVDELEGVSGIGPKKLADIRPLVAP